MKKDVNTAYEAWAWVRMLEALDRAGYAIVLKPTITQGKPNA